MPAGEARRLMWCECGYLLDGDNTRCPDCRGQDVLFDVRELYASRVVFRLNGEQAAAVFGEGCGGER